MPAGSPAKTIFGAAYDVEFGNIASAIATKPDNTTTASFLNVAVTGTAVPSTGIYAPATGVLGFAVNSGTAAGQIATTGAWAIPAATGAVSFSVTGASAQVTLQVTSGTNGSTSIPDINVSRPGSTANAQGKGPNLQLWDPTGGTVSMLQQSGGQTEFWQFRGSSWTQVGFFGTDKNLQILDDGGTMQLAGFRGTPVNSQSTNYTLQLSDRGKAVVMTASGTTVTVPSGVFNAGDIVTVINESNGTVTVGPGSGMGIFWYNGTNTSGARTMATASIATLFMATSSAAAISGSALS